jgi:hypothetical protein
VTVAEIFFEHDSASFGNKAMWIPVALGPVGAAAGIASYCSQRMAKTAAHCDRRGPGGFIGDASAAARGASWFTRRGQRLLPSSRSEW